MASQQAWTGPVWDQRRARRPRARRLRAVVLGWIQMVFGFMACECGSPKRDGAQACPRCLELDGHTAGDARLIGALRDLGGQASKYALVHETNWSRRNLERHLSCLQQAGRVKRRFDPARGKHECVFVLVG